MNATRRSTIRFLFGTGIAAALAAFTSVRWMHSKSPLASVWAKVWVGLCAFSLISGLVRLLYYRNRRNYFAEEMARRHSLANDRLKAKS